MTTKKTIFLTVGTGVIARNILNSSFYKKLREHFKVVIFTPLFDDPEFINRYGGEGVSFEQLHHRKLGRLELFFVSLHKSLIYNPSVAIKSFYSISSTMRQERTVGKILRNYGEYILFGLFLSKLPFLRSWLKTLDRTIFTEEYYAEVYEKHQPDIIFITNMGSDAEVYLLRSGKRRNVPNIGMTKSWDNFSKVGFRERVDTVMVWSDYMMEEVLKFQRYQKKNIKVVGIPQFDIILTIRNTCTKQDFVDLYKLNPNKKTILFAQSNPLVNQDDAYVCGVIKDWIINKGGKYQLLIRPHHRHKDAEKPFLPLADGEHVIVDLINKPSNFANGAWDLSPESEERRAMSLSYADVVVNSTSTIILDTAVAGTNYVCYAFDKDKNLPYGDSVRRIFDLLWFRDLKKHGFDALMVHNEEELTSRLELILETDGLQNPDVYQAIINRFCFLADGKAGERIYKAVEQLVA